MKELKGGVALITGGSKGIGFGIAEAFLNQGINVGITSRNKASAEKAAANLREKTDGKGEILPLQADVRNYEDQVNAVNALIDKFGKLDYVIANAGLGHFSPVDSLTVEQWKETVDTNLSGAFFTLKSSVEALKRTKGYYISISSLAGTNFFAGGAAYNASKFGLTGFTQAAMLDLRAHGIKVTTVMPGSVATHFNGNDPDESDSWKIQIEDIGQILVDLLKMHPRTLPSKIEVRPSIPPGAK